MYLRGQYAEVSRDSFSQHRITVAGQGSSVEWVSTISTATVMLVSMNEPRIAPEEVDMYQDEERERHCAITYGTIEYRANKIDIHTQDEQLSDLLHNLVVMHLKEDSVRCPNVRTDNLRQFCQSRKSFRVYSSSLRWYLR